MFKKLVVIIMCMLPLATFAQNFKFGNINSMEVFDAMPEKNTIQKELEALNTKYEGELQKMGEEHQRKVSDFLAAQDSLPENIKQRRAQEIGELEQRIQNFRQVAAQDFQQQQQTKFQPVFERISKAIKEVGQENGFTYIFDLSNSGILFFSETNTVDCLPLVKAKLGLK
ncbi:MAG: OmpH family outer membrane protein [Bacteroidales bacterium]